MMSTDITYDTFTQCSECEARFEVTSVQWLSVCKFPDTHRVSCLECKTQLRWNFTAGRFESVKPIVTTDNAHRESDLDVADRIERLHSLRERKQIQRFNTRGELVVDCGLCGKETSAHGEVILTGRFTKRWSVVGYRLGYVYKPVEIHKSEVIKSTPRVVCDTCAMSEHAEPRKVHREPVGESRHYGAYEYYRPSGVDGRDGERPDVASEEAWAQHDAKKRHLTRTQLRREQRKLAKLRQFQQAQDLLKGKA